MKLKEMTLCLPTSHDFVDFNQKLSKHEMATYNIAKIKKKARKLGKVILMFFWGTEGIIVKHSMPMESTVNCELCCDLLQKHLKSAKGPYFLVSSVLAWYYNCLLYTSRCV